MSEHYLFIHCRFLYEFCKGRFYGFVLEAVILSLTADCVQFESLVNPTKSRTFFFHLDI